jgi:hypothetical protein
MRCPRIPDNEIARPRLNLDPFEPLVLQPFIPCFGEPVPFVRPLPDPSLLGEFFVELLAQEMPAFGYDEAAVVRAVGQQIYQTLQTAKAWTVWILILMGPGGVGLQILTAVRRWLVVNDLQVRRIYMRADTNLGKDTLIASKLTIRSSVP